MSKDNSYTNQLKNIHCDGPSSNEVTDGQIGRDEVSDQTA